MNYLHNKRANREAVTGFEKKLLPLFFEDVSIKNRSVTGNRFFYKPV